MGTAEHLPGTCERLQFDLVLQLRSRPLVSRGPVVLSSGKVSNVFIDLMPVLTHYSTLDSLGEIICAYSDRLGLRQAGGPGVAGAALLAAGLLMPLSSISSGFIFHPEKGKLEGRFDPDAGVLLLDDVATTGGTLLRVARAVREAGGSVEHALVVVDREEGAREALAASGITLHRMLTLRDLEAAGHV